MKLKLPEGPVEAAVGSIEDWTSAEKYDLVLLCRTIEHLYDLKKAFANIRALLKSEGLFYCDIAEFIEICRREGPPQATTKIDHTYWLTQQAAPAIFRSQGFEILAIFATLSPDALGFLLRTAEPRSLAPVPQDWIYDQLRIFRQIDTDWQNYGRTPMDAADFFKQKLFRLKQRFSG